MFVLLVILASAIVIIAGVCAMALVRIESQFTSLCSSLMDTTSQTEEPSRLNLRYSPSRHNIKPLDL